MSKTIDPRGYVGSQKNRQLKPEEVAWARDAHHRGEVTTRDLAKRYGMGVESVRRMLRGDTYGDVGQALTTQKDLREFEKAMNDGADIHAGVYAEIARAVAAKEQAALPKPVDAVEMYLKGELPPQAAPVGKHEIETEASSALGKPGDGDPFGSE